MISRNLTRASLAFLLASPAYGVTNPQAPEAPVEQLTEGDFDLDTDDLDTPYDQVTDEDLNDDSEVVDSTLGAEQEADESLTVEPKDDGQDIAQAADEYLAKTDLKDAEIAAAGPAPRSEQVALQLPTDETSPVVAEVAPVKEPAALASVLAAKPQNTKTSLVAKIQQALIAQGAAIDADGQMGAKTKAALLEYQKKNGLAADGVAGPGTLAKLGVAR